MAPPVRVDDGFLLHVVVPVHEKVRADSLARLGDPLATGHPPCVESASTTASPASRVLTLKMVIPREMRNGLATTPGTASRSMSALRVSSVTGVLAPWRKPASPD